MSDEQVRDETLTMILAGHETTANTLAWALFLLAQNPQVAQGVRQEGRALTSALAALMSHVPLPLGGEVR